MGVYVIYPTYKIPGNSQNPPTQCTKWFPNKYFSFLILLLFLKQIILVFCIIWFSSTWFWRKYKEQCAPHTKEFCFVTDHSYTRAEVMFLIPRQSEWFTQFRNIVFWPASFKFHIVFALLTLLFFLQKYFLDMFLRSLMWQVLNMEIRVLNYFNFNLSAPTTKAFLRYLNLILFSNLDFIRYAIMTFLILFLGRPHLGLRRYLRAAQASYKVHLQLEWLIMYLTI